MSSWQHRILKKKPLCKLVSVQFSHSVLSYSLRPHGLQYVRVPCPPPTPRAYSNSCPLSHWCHPTILSSAIPFSSCFQSFLASGFFPVSQFFASGGQNIDHFRFSISPSNEYSGLISFRIDWFEVLVVRGTLMTWIWTLMTWIEQQYILNLDFDNKLVICSVYPWVEEDCRKMRGWERGYSVNHCSYHHVLSQGYINLRWLLQK